jgi:L-seryl-tRNA(Ser) seleniumtransferase
MARPADEIRALAERLLGPLAARLGAAFEVGVVACLSQVGSGALPVGRLPSHALRIVALGPRRDRGRSLGRIAAALRALPIPILGRVHEEALLLDLRCLEDEAAFIAQLSHLPSP